MLNCFNGGCEYLPRLTRLISLQPTGDPYHEYFFVDLAGTSLICLSSCLVSSITDNMHCIGTKAESTTGSFRVNEVNHLPDLLYAFLVSMLATVQHLIER